MHLGGGGVLGCAEVGPKFGGGFGDVMIHREDQEHENFMDLHFFTQVVWCASRLPFTDAKNKVRY